MRTHVKRSSFALVALTMSLSAVLAQNTSAPASPPPSNTQNSAGPAGEVDNSVKSILDYNFNHQAGDQTAAKGEQDVLEALADKIKALDVLKTPALDDPEIRARFETYVSLPAVPDSDIKDYFDKMGQISNLLSQNDTFSAWKLLYALSEHKDLDAGISRELANRVEGVWNSNRAQDSLAQVNDKLRDNIDMYGHNADLIADDLHQQALEEGQKQNAGNSANTQNNSSSSNSPLMNVSPNADPASAEAAVMPMMSGALQRKMELTNEYLKLLEARAKIKFNEISADQMSDQDKSDFADYIKMLYDTHRYYHVIIAADFYRALFNVADLDLPGNINAQANAPTLTNPRAAGDMMSVTSKSMGLNGQVPINAITAAGNAIGFTNPLGPTEGGHPLSISDEVTSALEINNRVNESIEVFKYKAGQGEIAAAAEQLQNAFLANEYHPALQGLDRVEKEKVGDFLAKLAVLKNQLEVRDFEQVNGQIDDIKKIASDFDSTEPLALVNGVKLETELRIGKAKLLAQGGQLDESMKEFATAAEEWPGNPDLQTSASTFFIPRTCRMSRLPNLTG